MYKLLCELIKHVLKLKGKIYPIFFLNFMQPCAADGASMWRHEGQGGGLLLRQPPEAAGLLLSGGGVQAMRAQGQRVGVCEPSTANLGLQEHLRLFYL